MNRVVAVVGVGFAIASLALAGCSTSGGVTAPPTVSASAQTVTVTAPAVTTVPTTSSSGDSYLDWAQQNTVGDKLPEFAIDNPTSAREFAEGYCRLLGDSPIQSPDMVVGVIKKHYNGSTTQSLALLEQAVAAYCPEKSRYLN